MDIMSRLRALKARSGFTLVEMICAVAIFGVIMVALFALFDPINRISQMIKGDSEAERLSLAVADYMAAQFQTATDIEGYWVDGSWNTFGDEVFAFIEANKEDVDMPRALLIKRFDNITYLFNVNLKQLPLIGDLTADSAVINALFSSSGGPGSALYNDHRLFNRAYYDNIQLQFFIWDHIIAPVPPSTSKTYLLKIQIEAYRDMNRNGSFADVEDLRSKANRPNVIELVNMEKQNPYHTRVCNVKFFDTAGTQTADYPPDAYAASWNGDYLILYNNFTS